jgi:hypothetical protein
VLDLEREVEQDGLSWLLRDTIKRLRQRVVLREIIVIDHHGRPSENDAPNEPQVVMTESFLASRVGHFWRAPENSPKIVDPSEIRSPSPLPRKGR